MSASKGTSASDLRVGISGWTYAPWRGVFYPAGLRQADELAYASRRLNSIEINGTFYSLHKPASFRSWHDATPDDFVFTVKCPRYITHIKRLRDVKQPLANFFASGLFALGKKLGPLLWQLPPGFKFDADKLEAFFDMLPHAPSAAAALAARHDDKVRGRALIEVSPGTRFRHALEVRHPSFLDPAFLPLLRKHNIAIVIADTAGKWPQIEEVTADFVYLRLHGADELYVSGYTPKGLDQWAAKIRSWVGRGKSQVQDAFVYFDNDVKVRSPADAVGLSERLGVPAGDARAGRWPMEVSGENGAQGAPAAGAKGVKSARKPSAKAKASKRTRSSAKRAALRETAPGETARAEWPAVTRSKRSK